MKKNVLLWGIPVAILLFVSGVLAAIKDYDYYLFVNNEMAERTYWTVFGFLYLIAGLYGLIYIFISEEENDSNGELNFTFKDFLVSFGFIAVPALVLCFVGYYALTTSVGDLTILSFIEQYDVLSYVQFAFAILCFLVFFNSYPRTKPKNWLMLVISILVILSGFMKLMVFEGMHWYYLSYVVYAISIGLFIFRTILDVKDTETYY